jgi:hypothetical protein
MYRLIRFGNVDLQHYNQVDTVGSGATPTAYQNLPEGGALDLFGSQQKHPGTVERTKTMRLSASTNSALSTLYFQLIAQRGKRDKLYRQMANGDIHWQYARLVEVTAERNYETAKYKTIQDVSLKFVTQEAFWRGQAVGEWNLDSGEYFDTGLTLDMGRSYPMPQGPNGATISIGTDAGRAPTRAMRILITAGASPIGDISVARYIGISEVIDSVRFHGTVAANTTLVIDTGTMQVLNDGVDAYASLELENISADMASWFSLDIGDNLIAFGFTEGSIDGQIEFDYYEAWY